MHHSLCPNLILPELHCLATHRSDWAQLLSSWATRLVTTARYATMLSYDNIFSFSNLFYTVHMLGTLRLKSQIITHHITYISRISAPIIMIERRLCHANWFGSEIQERRGTNVRETQTTGTAAAQRQQMPCAGSPQCQLSTTTGPIFWRVWGSSLLRTCFSL